MQGRATLFEGTTPLIGHVFRDVAVPTTLGQLQEVLDSELSLLPQAIKHNSDIYPWLGKGRCGFIPSPRVFASN